MDTQLVDRPATGSATAGPRRALWSLVLLGWLVVAAVLAPLGGHLGEVADDSLTALLPEQAQSRQVLELGERFTTQDVLPAVVVYAQDHELSGADRATLAAEAVRLQSVLGERLAGPVTGPVYAADARAAQLVVPFAGSDVVDVEPAVADLREELKRAPAGTPASYLTGPAGIAADVRGALGAIDVLLVAVTSVVILIILISVYRSPLLPFLVLTVAGMSLGITQGVLYLLARAGVISLGSDVQGILNVLVLGAATDYAMLLVARFRQELARRAPAPALSAAWRGSLGPIVASAATVALGLLCLLVSDLGINRDLGPAGAIGIACSLVAVLTLLPALLALAGRAAFWPRRPSQTPVDGTGAGWSRVAGLVGRRPRPVWLASAGVLAVLSLGMLRLDATGIPDSAMVMGEAESERGQQVLAAHFPGGASGPTQVLTSATSVPAVLEAAGATSGVASAAAYPTAKAPAVIGGLSRVDVVLTDAPDSPAAQGTVRALRTALAAVSGADAKVGGPTAIEVDFNAAAERDRIVMPLLLLVVFLILALLLRALLAPLLLLATVVLSFAAALGVSAVAFDLLGLPGVDSTYPLHAFVFLVALGVDYNIFLVHRVREEARTLGTRAGTIRALMVTGTVITSAGVVLAATFSALALIPLVLLVELAFTVAFGVLLDTFLVRSLLVPALAVDLGDGFWWPDRHPQQALLGQQGQRRRSIRVLPSVLGFTRSRSRNSATPSS